MKRVIYQKLVQWKSSKLRKPLILTGARQTGKTWILNAFGKEEFANVHYLNFQENKPLCSIFSESLEPEKIISAIEFTTGSVIDKRNDLLVFDEIQDCPEALTSLKFFCENLPEMPVCCAGSLLGVYLTDQPFPVGKVDFISMYPMSFLEFLQAINDIKGLEAFKNTSLISPLPEVVHNHLLSVFKEYMVVGGLPEAVQNYRSHSENKLSALKIVRKNQADLIKAYRADFGKYAGKAVAQNINAVFESIPSQIARDRKKFKASEVKPGGRMSGLINAVDWLSGAGLAIKTLIANSGELPFSAFTKANFFKLYLFDTGILGAMAGLSPEVLLQKSDLFATFKGAFCENIVAQALISSDISAVYAWASNTAEIEFIIERSGIVFPVEVKSGKSGKLKSLNVFQNKYKVPWRIRINTMNMQKNDETGFINIPLYMTERLPELLDQIQV